MNYLPLDQARKQLQNIPQVKRAYNLYEIDFKTKNTLLAELAEKGRKITRAHFQEV